MPDLEEFRALVGERFSTAGVELALTSAEPLGEAPAPQLPAPFRLEFRGPPQPVLAQDTHALAHGERVYEIFVGPIGRTATGTTYEAIFS